MGIEEPTKAPPVGQSELTGGLCVLVSLGDMYADQCHCGERAYFGEASQKGPNGCVEAVRIGKVFCSNHIPPHLAAYNAQSNPRAIASRVD